MCLVSCVNEFNLTVFSSFLLVSFDLSLSSGGGMGRWWSQSSWSISAAQIKSALDFLETVYAQHSISFREKRRGRERLLLVSLPALFQDSAD